MHLLILSDDVWCFNITVGCILTAQNISGKPPQPTCQNVACFACQVRCPGDIWEGNRGQESRRRERKLVWKASDTFAPAVPTCLVMEDHDWYRKVPTGWKPQRANALLLYCLRKSTSHFDDDFRSYSFCYSFYFFIVWWGTPLGREGDRASGCRGSLELWPIESFSGPGSRSADEARLNIANRSWKICTCAGSPSSPASPGLVPSWESSFFYMCAGRHVHTHTHTHTHTRARACALHAPQVRKASWEREVSVKSDGKMKNKKHEIPE